jgi:hypothetical protein
LIALINITAFVDVNNAVVAEENLSASPSALNFVKLLGGVFFESWLPIDL